MAALLELQGVSRRFGGFLAVSKVDLAVAAGENLGLLRDPAVPVFDALRDPASLSPALRAALAEPVPLSVGKANMRSTVHRPQHADVVATRLFAADGRVAARLLHAARGVVGLLAQADQHHPAQRLAGTQHHAGLALLAGERPGRRRPCDGAAARRVGRRPKPGRLRALQHQQRKCARTRQGGRSELGIEHEVSGVSVPDISSAAPLCQGASLWLHRHDGRSSHAEPRRRPRPPCRRRDPCGAGQGVRDAPQDGPQPGDRGRPRGGGADPRRVARRDAGHPGDRRGGDGGRAHARRPPHLLARGPAGRHAPSPTPKP